MKEIKMKIPSWMSGLASSLKNALPNFDRLKNEITLFMKIVVGFWLVQKGVDYWNMERLGTPISKWDYTYLTTEAYSILRICIAYLGARVMLSSISPMLSKFGETEFVNKFKELTAWQQIKVFLFVLFALLFGVIWLSVSQTAGLMT